MQKAAVCALPGEDAVLERLCSLQREKTSPNAREEVEQQGLISLLAGARNSTASWGDCAAVSEKANRTLPADRVTGAYTKELKPASTQNLHMDVYSSFIHNRQGLKAATLVFSEWITELAPLDNGIRGSPCTRK